MADQSATEPPKAKTWHRLGMLAGPALILLSFLGLAVPWQPAALEMDRDASLRHALHALYANDAQFGTEVVHQFGPYGFAGTQEFHPATYTRVVLFRTWIALALALLTLWVACRLLPSSWWGLPWSLAFAALVTWYDVGFLLLPQMVLLASIYARGWTRVGLLACATPAMALISLMQFKLFVMTLATLGVLLVLACSQGWAARRSGSPGDRGGWMRASALPWLAAYAASLVFLWLLAGQELGNLLTFYRGSFHLSAVYGASLSQSGPLWQAAGYVLFGGLLTLAVASSSLRRNSWLGVAPAVSLGLFLILAFRHAFVRQDAQHVGEGAMYGLAAVLLYGAITLAYEFQPRDGGDGGSPRRMVPMAVAAVAFAAFCSQLLLLCGWPAPHLGKFYWERAATLSAHAQGFGRFLADPLWFEERFQQEAQLIQARYPLPDLPGTVDLYPSDLGILFAHGLDVRHRPLLQSHQASDPRLSALNVRQLRGADGPEHVVIGISPIDGRLAAMDDSLSWPQLLARYRPRSARDSMLFLDRAESPAQVVWGIPQILPLEFNAWHDLEPADDELLWADFELERTLAGRLSGLLYREPQLYLFVRLQNGEERSFRLPPGIAEAGFLISPVIDSSTDFAGLYKADPAELVGRRIVALQIALSKAWSYQPNIQVRLRSLAIRRATIPP